MNGSIAQTQEQIKMNAPRDQISKFLLAGGYREGSWERLSPHLTEQSVFLFHKVRFQFARDLIDSQDRVLDIGCGTGYGTSILAGQAHHVTAVDNSSEAISFAREYFPAENIDYRCGDWKSELGKSLYDVIIAFEFLEHIEEQETLVRVVCEHLKDQGMFIVSTPNSEFSSGNNPFHKRELTTPEFRILLETFFKTVSVLGQYVRPEFFDRQKKMLDYVEMQSVMPKWFRHRRRPYAEQHRRMLVDELIGLSEADVLITQGDYAKRNAKINIAVCKTRLR